MLTVNLIAARRAAQLKYRRLGETLVRVSIFLALLIIVFVVLEGISLRQGEQRIAQISLAEIAYRQQAAEVKRLKTLNAELLPRVQVVETADRHLDHWRYLYAQIASSVPADVAADGISYTVSNTGGKTFDIEAHGRNGYAPSKFLLALERQPGFSDLKMGPVALTSPDRATVSAKLIVKPLPEDAPPPPATPPTAGKK